MSPTEYQFLLTTPYFKNCSLTEIADFYRHLDICHLNKGSCVFVQGEMENSWYLVRRGTILLKRRSASGITHVLAEMTAGVGFGEMGLLEKAPRLATAEISDNAILYKLHGETFFQLLDEQNPIAMRMLRAMAITQSQRLREMTITLQDITDLDDLGDYTPIQNPLDVNSLLTASLFL